MDQIYRTTVRVRNGWFTEGVVHFSTTERPVVRTMGNGYYVFQTKDAERLVRYVLGYTIEPEFAEPIAGWLTDHRSGETRKLVYTDLFKEAVKIEVERLLKESPV